MRRLLLAVLLACGARAETETTFQTVVVKKGDTLWGIANTWLKDPSKWDQILKHNTLPSSDPTVALPGMTLKVPLTLIKEDLRAAHLIYKNNRVDFRRKATADWTGADEGMQLFKGDALRTLEDAHAKVKFLNADLLSLDPNSLVIIKPPKQEFDIELKTGSIFTGKSRVVTASARVTPKTRDTQYSTAIKPDFTTVVAVHKGIAAVEAQGSSVDVKAGMATEVKMGQAPGAPHKIPDLPDFEARAAAFNGEAIRRSAKLEGGAVAAGGAAAEEIERAPDASGLRGELSSLRVGVPILNYRMQASLSREFDKILWDRTFDPEDKVDMKYERLTPGVYWFRIALVDLLGTQGKWSEPRLFSLGLAKKGEERIDLKDAVKIVKPARVDESAWGKDYKVVGVVKSDRVTVTVNGKSVRQDDYGNFSVDVRLREGVNDLQIVVTDPQGNSMTIPRRLTYSP